MNKTIIIGNLGADPEVRYTGSGTAVCNMRIATNEFWKDKNGQRQEHTEWHRVVAWGRQAETCGEFLAKGRLVSVEGKLRTKQWTDREGNKRYTTEIHASNVIFLGGRGEQPAQRTQSQNESQVPEAGIEEPVLNEDAQEVYVSDDVPF